MKFQLLILAGLLSLASCTRKTYWSGFHGPAYLPRKPAPKPTPVLTDAAQRAAYVRHLDSLTATKWRIPPCQERPLKPKKQGL